jgi:type VI secretion system FHA domain protein
LVAPPVPPSRAAPPGRVPAAGTLENLLRGAGLDPAQTQLSQEVAGQLGEVLRIVVEGTMQVLQARNQIRKEFRMASTQVAQKNNNPLKFSADVADALHKLLVQRSPAYLDTVNSFTDAFDDIRVHQLAMLSSLRVAFEYMLQQFDPEVLQTQFARQAGRSSVLGIGGKPKLWEAYVARYGELAADRDFAFRRLFGEEFGKAYEQNLEQQKHLLKASKNVK